MILQAPKRVRTEEYGPEQRIDGWGLGSPQQKARSASAHPLAYPYLTRDGGIILTTVLREATNQISSTLSDEATRATNQIWSSLLFELLPAFSISTDRA